MTDREKREIEMLPPKYRPLGAWEYFGYTFLFAIPLIGLIMMIIFALDGSNVVRRSFARSYFCLFIIVGVLSGILLVIVAVGGIAASVVS